MTSPAIKPDDYLNQLPEDRREPMKRLRQVIIKNLPTGFKEQMSYGMLGYIVPIDTYPKGYHADPKTPLPFVCLASQKNYIALYHMGIYAFPSVLKWFTNEYPKHSATKLDMGKSCIRFKKPDQIPYELIGELMKKISVKQWVECYENNVAAVRS